MKAEWVRVSDKRTGHHYTVSEWAFDSTVHNRLKSSAVDRNGNPRPPKDKLPLATQRNQPATTIETEPKDGSEGVK